MKNFGLGWFGWLALCAAAACNTHVEAHLSSMPQVEAMTTLSVSPAIQAAAADVYSQATSGAPASHYRFVGRIVPGLDNPDAQQVISFAGSMIQARFSASEATLHLTQDGGSSFEVILDGQEPVTIDPHEEATTFSGLDPNVVHNFELIKRNEAGFGIGFFDGLTLAEGGTFLAPIANASRRIEVIGAAAAQGFGDLDTGDCTGGVQKEDATQSFGLLAGRILGADVSDTGGTGLGILRNADGSTEDTLPDVWARGNAVDSSSVWDFAKYQPDLVVLSAGGSDFAKGVPDAKLFISAYKAFVQRIRTAYPKASIVCAVDPTLSGVNAAVATQDIHDAVEQLIEEGDSRVQFVDFGSIGDSGGCNGEPNVAFQRAMAAVVVAAAQRSLAW